MHCASSRLSGFICRPIRKVKVLKILLYGINFAPELTGIGKYTGEMAAWLAERGHAVRVVTAPPYYPDWKVGMRAGEKGPRASSGLLPSHLGSTM